MTELHKRNDENEEQFIWRLGREKDAGTLDLEWSEIAKIINKECREDENEYRDESAYRKPYQQAKRFYEAGVFEDLTSEKYAELIRAEQRELRKERQKFSDEKLEYNRWLREEARDELIIEKFCQAVSSLPTLVHPNFRIIDTGNAKKCGILCFADTHYGAEFCIKGLYGEIINEYSPEIFEKRMGELLNMTIEKVRKEGFTKIKIFSLGDELDGILRASQLMKLRYGIVDSAIRYSEFICNWLNALTNYVKVEFYMVEGNHTELRMIGQPKGTFKDDNMSKIIKEFIKTRMANNENFSFFENESGLIFSDALGFNILGIHGEVKNLSKALQNFSTIYGINVDILIGAHLHHFETETVGVKKDVVSIPSIMGLDGYSVELEKTADAGALFLTVEEDKGIIEQTIFKFDR